MALNYEVLTLGRDMLGEGPSWDSNSKTLLWVDIKGHRVREATLDGEIVSEWDTPTDVGFAVPTDKQRTLMVGLRDGLWSMDRDTGSLEPYWLGLRGKSENRINDGKVDPSGRLWFGTMHDRETKASSALYRLSGQSVTQQLDGIITSNGLGWSPDQKTFYYTDSIARTIWSFEYDVEDGTLSNQRIFATDPKGYVPDGLAVDTDGCIWSAKWNGSKVVRYSPSGNEDRVLEMPVRKPTSVAFSGENLDVMVVTSAQLEEPLDGALAGSVFLMSVGATGNKEVPAQIG